MIRSLRLYLSRAIQTKLYSTSEINENTLEKSLLQNLSAEFDDTSYISYAISKNKILAKTPFDEWRDRIHIFKSFSLNDSECFKMISQYPPLLRIPKADLEDSIRTWSVCHFPFQDFRYLVIMAPKVLSVDDGEIRKRVPYFNSLFKSSKSTVTLIIKCPNIMFDHWKSTVDKMNYLLNVRGVGKNEILQSAAMSKPLSFIKLRFDLLEKTGFYKQPIMHAHKKNKFKTVKHINPHLRNVTDTDDSTFSNQVIGITIEEYTVYKDLFENFDEDEDEDDDDEVQKYLKR